MKRYISAIKLAVVLLAIGAALGKYSGRTRLAPRQTVQVTSTSPTADVDVDFAHEPLWAYGFDKPPAPGDTAVPQLPPTRALRPDKDSAEQTRPIRLDGSRASYSLVDIRDGHNAIDWFPEDHPPMPRVVANGPAALGERGRGCGFCHLPNGKGRPENAPLAGLPVPYFIRQLEDFRSGRRRSAEPRKANTNTMIELAKALTDEEARDAAEYFASIPYTSWIRVVETDSVPTMRIVGNLFLPISRKKAEPIAGRIIEVPEDVEQTELYRNPRSGFIAYVPTGSIEKGADLVTTGGLAMQGNRQARQKTTPCGTCHGSDLMGLADVPPVAGRSPSYLVRQLWDIRQDTRNGIAAQAMKPVVANLTGDDLVAIAAYVSSRHGR
ncbi:MAG: c-type cytochrome [Gemmatimonadales bacterium]|nr:c-type cytochrome [Gemmatimonadales bacterium]